MKEGGTRSTTSPVATRPVITAQAPTPGIVPALTGTVVFSATVGSRLLSSLIVGDDGLCSSVTCTKNKHL